MTSRGLHIVILTRSQRAADSPAWGLSQDSKIVEQVLREVNASGHTRIESIDHIDPLSFYGGPRKPRNVDIQIHLEVPCSAAWKWAKVNIVVVNPEWWPMHAWDWVLRPKTEGGADMLVFKSPHARKLFPEIEDARVRIVSWRAGPMIQTVLNGLNPKTASASKNFLYLVGGSVNKLLAAKQICGLWKSTWPQCKIIGTSAVIDILRPYVEKKSNVILKVSLESENARIIEQVQHSYHIVASVAEGFGYTFAEAAAVGALPLWTGLPVYDAQWGNLLGDIGRIPVTVCTDSEKTHRLMPVIFTDADVVTAVEKLLALTADETAHLCGSLRHLASTRIKEFRHDWRGIIHTAAQKLQSTTTLSLPPRPLAVNDLPHVAVITLTHNRPRWFGNMARNILTADYPSDKLTWIIADDSDGMGRIDEAVVKFQSTNRQINVKYMSLSKKLPIGAKRNRACDAAPENVSVFVMMDDDDHYPAGSIAARCAWLSATRSGCVYCSTLPMYDCTRYISAINVPPHDLSPAQRVSEASMAFTREFYTASKFPAGVSIAEGEGFIAGRESQTAEIPPEGIIVSFIHGKNATSRRVPQESEPNGCHYGFDDTYFRYISELGMV